MPDEVGSATVERAYALACSGQFAGVRELIVRLRADGHVTAMTDLRSRTFRRELRQICERGVSAVRRVP